jgi:chemosensory pili system protein ChpA (sensor histidine kinase/response regulator)
LSELTQSYVAESFSAGGISMPFFWAGALLQSSARSSEAVIKTASVVVLRSAQQLIAIHVDEVLGNQEVVVKNLGPQLSRLPGLSGMTVLPSGAVVLIYNPVALASVYGTGAIELQRSAQGDAANSMLVSDARSAVSKQVPLVLVVDDSITVRRVTQRMLQREGYRVALAVDGIQGLERLREEMPTVILSDIEMPRMDGFEFARSVRSNRLWKDLPIITISSRTAEKHREIAREIGVNHYLGKPYGEEELLGLIRGYVMLNTVKT